MNKVRAWLLDFFADPAEDRARQASEVATLRREANEIEQVARAAIGRAEPTGVLLRDLITGAYDPHRPPYARRILTDV